MHRKDSNLLTTVIVSGITYLQLSDNPVIISAHVLPAAVRVCVTVGVCGRQMLMIRVYVMRWLFNKVEAQPQGQRSGGFLCVLGPGFRAGE